jgi:hypothetical protein
MSGNASHRRNLAPDERLQIIAKSEAGCTTGELADEFRVTSKCIRDTLRRWRLHHTTVDLPRSGRPSKTTPRDVRALYRQVRKTPKINYKALLQKVDLVPRISRTTAYRRLKEEHLHKFRCKRRPKIVRKSARERLQWERRWRSFDFKRRTMRFSDECSVQVGSGSDPEWCFRLPDEKWRHEMVEELATGRPAAQMV